MAEGVAIALWYNLCAKDKTPITTNNSFSTSIKDHSIFCCLFWGTWKEGRDLILLGPSQPTIVVYTYVRSMHNFGHRGNPSYNMDSDARVNPWYRIWSSALARKSAWAEPNALGRREEPIFVYDTISAILDLAVPSCNFFFFFFLFSNRLYISHC